CRREDLAAVDACLTAAAGLSMVDAIQGAYFQSRGLLLALRAGEPRRLVLTLALEGAHESIGGTPSPRRSTRLLAAAAEGAGGVDEVARPYLLGVVSLTRGIGATFAGDWPASQQLCEQAEAVFREARREARVGLMLDRSTARWLALTSLQFMGELAEVARR